MLDLQPEEILEKAFAEMTRKNDEVGSLAQIIVGDWLIRVELIDPEGPPALAVYDKKTLQLLVRSSYLDWLEPEGIPF